MNHLTFFLDFFNESYVTSLRFFTFYTFCPILCTFYIDSYRFVSNFFFFPLILTSISIMDSTGILANFFCQGLIFKVT